MKEVFKELAKKIIIKEELIFFLEEINLIQVLIFKNIDTPLPKKAEGKTSEEFRKELEKLETKKIISKDPENNRIFFEKLKKHLQNLPQVKIETAFRPSKEFIDKISFWLEKEIKQKVILDLIFNPEITGGAIIEYQGKRLDFSLAKKIDQLISQKQL